MFVKICGKTTGFDEKNKHIEMSENYDSDENMNEIDDDEIELDDDDLEEDLEDGESMLEPQVQDFYLYIWISTFWPMHEWLILSQKN